MAKNRWIVPVGDRGRIEVQIKTNAFRSFWFEIVNDDGDTEVVVELDDDELEHLGRVIDRVISDTAAGATARDEQGGA